MELTGSTGTYWDSPVTICCAVLIHSCLTLCDPMDCSPPGSWIHGILQARILEWVAIPFSRGSSRPRDQTRVSCIADRFFTETPGKPPVTVTSYNSVTAMWGACYPTAERRKDPSWETSGMLRVGAISGFKPGPHLPTPAPSTPP